MGQRHVHAPLLQLPPELCTPVRTELETVLQSPEFRQSEQAKRLLRYLVDRSLAGDAEALKERAIGVAVFHLETGYDTNENPIVRVRANELRKRLAKYSQHATGATIRLEVPAGAYRVEFHPVTAPAEVPARRESHRQRWYALGGVMLAIVAAVGIFSGVGRPTDPLTDFWRPALESPNPVILCSGHPVVYTLSRNFRDRVRGAASDHFQSLTESLVIPPALSLRGDDIIAIRDQYIGLGSAESVARIYGWLARHHKDADIRFANDLSFSDLRRGPAFVFGAFQNRWTVEFTRGLRFVFISQGPVPGVRDNTTGKTWLLPNLGQDGRTDEDYVVISRVLNSTSGEFVVAAAGITQYGGHTVAEVLTQPQILTAATRELRPGWRNRNLQLLFHVRVIGGTAGPPELLAAHEW